MLDLKRKSCKAGRVRIFRCSLTPKEIVSFFPAKAAFFLRKGLKNPLEVLRKESNPNHSSDPHGVFLDDVFLFGESYAMTIPETYIWS